MQKYVLTERNINDMTGRIKKFFDSFTKRNDGIIEWYATPRKNFERKNKCIFTYRSRPTSKDVYISEIKSKPFIHIEAPMRLEIPIGSIIYFLGGNKIIFRFQYQHHYRNSKGRSYSGDKLLYTNIVDVYERGISKDWDACDDVCDEE